MAEAKKKRGRPPGSKNKTSAAKKSTGKGSASKSGKGSTGSNTSKTSRTKATEREAEAYIEKMAGNQLRDEIWSIVIIAIGIFLAISLQTTAAGKLGNGIHVLFLGIFGWVAYMLPYYMILYGILMFTKKMAHVTVRSIFFVVVIFLCISVLNSAQFLDSQTYSLSGDFMKSMFASGQEKTSGGAFGMSVGLLLVKVIGLMGLYIFCIALIIISIMLITKTPFSHYLDEMKGKKALRKEREESDAEEAAAYREYEREKTRKEVGEEHMTSFEKEIPIEAKLAPIMNQKSQVRREVGLSQGQLKIMDYMNDDSLFERNTEQEKTPIRIIEHVPIEIQHEEPEAVIENNHEEEPEAVIEKETEKEIEENDFPEKHEGHKEPEKPADSKDSNLVGLTQKKETSAPKMTNSVAAAASLAPSEVNLAVTTPKNYKLPPIDLLKLPIPDPKAGKGESLQAKAQKLEQTLKDFNVDAQVVQVTKGPAVTRYEIHPNTGVKVNSIVRLADDIALNLEAKSIRIEAPIPGKAAVGIEVENESVNMVTIREIIGSKNFKDATSKITFSVGKDISGNAIIANLKSMPHLLIAGSTGSGKSVCINSIIVSMLYKSKPEEVKFVLIDPKVVELGNYNGIPHLLIPVVTDPSKAAAALNWAVAEMTDRYKKFAEEGVRDLESFNEAVKKKKEADRYLPQIVIIIDELADLMMAAPSQVEESICRLAQMARAAGMHLIVATQRPSVDVITGVIKANIPSRIAFAVSSQFDSRTILDMGGAEKLVGKGDMLFNPLGMAKPIRVQGTFISDKEVNSVIEFVKGQTEGEAEYANDVMHTIEKVQSSSPDDDEDELLSTAIEAIVKSKQASVSGLQRRFRIGYNRAARLVDMMESRGIVGPADGSRPRQVLMNEEELEELKGLDKESEG